MQHVQNAKIVFQKHKLPKILQVSVENAEERCVRRAGSSFILLSRGQGIVHLHYSCLDDILK